AGQARKPSFTKQLRRVCVEAIKRPQYQRDGADREGASIPVVDEIARRPVLRTLSRRDGICAPPWGMADDPIDAFRLALRAYTGTSGGEPTYDKEQIRAIALLVERAPEGRTVMSNEDYQLIYSRAAQESDRWRNQLELEREQTYARAARILRRWIEGGG